MTETICEPVKPMMNPTHLGPLIREKIDELGGSISDTAALLGCDFLDLSRLLVREASASMEIAEAMANIGWGTADHWMRMQESNELEQARRVKLAG